MARLALKGMNESKLQLVSRHNDYKIALEKRDSIIKRGYKAAVLATGGKRWRVVTDGSRLK